MESDRFGFISQQYLSKSYVTLSKSLNLLKIPFPYLQNMDLIATIKSSNSIIKVKDETQYSFPTSLHLLTFRNHLFACLLICLFWYGLFIFSDVITTLIKIMKAFYKL